MHRASKNEEAPQISLLKWYLLCNNVNVAYALSYINTTILLNGNFTALYFPSLNFLLFVLKINFRVAHFDFHKGSK